MNLFEGLLLANLAVSLWTTYQVGRAKTDIDNLYEGVGLALSQSEKT